MTAVNSNIAAGEPQLRRAATRGVALNAVQSVLARVVLLGSQVALGWLLSPEELGVAALAFTVITITWSLVGFGTTEVLQQRARHSALWERTVFFVCVGFGLVCLTVMVLIAPLVAMIFGEPQMKAMLWLIAPALLMASIAAVSMSKLLSGLRFRAFATFEMADVFFTQALTILFAWQGFGVYSLALPIPIVIAVKSLLLWRAAPPVLSGRTSLARLRTTFSAGGLIVRSKLLTAFGQVDYLVLGLFAVAREVGFYTFAFRLAAVPVRVVATNLQVVLLPTLASLRGDAERQREAAVRAGRILLFIVTPLCFLQALLADPFLTLLFGDKWRPSVLLIQILSIGLAVEGLGAVSRAHLTASGAFRQLARYSVINAVVILAAVSAGALLYDAIGVAVAMSCGTIVLQSTIFTRIFAPKGRRLATVADVLARPYLLTTAATLCGFWAARLVEGPVADMLVSGSVYAAVYAVLVALFAPVTFKDICGLVADLAGPALNLIRRRA